MDTKKRILKLFKEINHFISENSYSTNALLFLLNKYSLHLNKRRPSKKSLCGIDRGTFSEINMKFYDRFPKKFISSLSYSLILSLPGKTKYDSGISIDTSGKNILFLSPDIHVSSSVENANSMSFGFKSSMPLPSSFNLLQICPVSMEEEVDLSSQTTVFQIVGGHASSYRPNSFDYIYFSDSKSTEMTKVFLNNIRRLLSTDGKFVFITSLNFFTSPIHLKKRKFVLENYSVAKIEIKTSYLRLFLNFSEDNAPISVSTDNSVVEISQSDLLFNNLFTFDLSISDDEYKLLRKIEEFSPHCCGEYFNYFLGMFPRKNNPPSIEKLRRHNRFKPVINSRDITPYSLPSPSGWTIPEEANFSQIPKIDNFLQDKLLFKFVSPKPQCTVDKESLYFFNDVAGVFPKTKNTLMDFAEGFFNSKLLSFYYKNRFPNNPKFLKKNFNRLPFFNCSTNIQRIIASTVANIKKIHQKDQISHPDLYSSGGEYSKELSRLDNYFYQLFKLSRDEINIIQNSSK